MSRHFLRYLPWESLCHWKTAYGVERYAGSNLFDGLGVAIGDILWGVSIPLDATKRQLSVGLVLYGRLQIGTITSDSGLIRRLMGTDDIWDANRFVIAKLGDEAPYSAIDISGIASRLEFDSAVSRRLIINDDGRIPAQQLQTIRRLTPESAHLLEGTWSANAHL